VDGEGEGGQDVFDERFDGDRCAVILLKFDACQAEIERAQVRIWSTSEG